MESDAYRNWKVRNIVWCAFCGIREENGPGYTFCAQCDAYFHMLADQLED